LTYERRGAILNAVEKNSTGKEEENECHTLMITEN
jgi:hypothetical protein